MTTEEFLIEAHDGSILDNTSRDGYDDRFGCFLNGTLAQVGQ